MNVLLTWFPIMTDNAVEQLIQYKLSSQSAWPSTGITVSKETAFYTITGLLDDTSYDFRVATICQFGGPCFTPIKTLIRNTVPTTPVPTTPVPTTPAPTTPVPTTPVPTTPVPTTPPPSTPTPTTPVPTTPAPTTPVPTTPVPTTPVPTTPVPTTPAPVPINIYWDFKQFNESDGTLWGTVNGNNIIEEFEDGDGMVTSTSGNEMLVSVGALIGSTKTLAITDELNNVICDITATGATSFSFMLQPGKTYYIVATTTIHAVTTQVPPTTNVPPTTPPPTTEDLTCTTWSLVGSGNAVYEYKNCLTGNFAYVAIGSNQEKYVCGRTSYGLVRMGGQEATVTVVGSGCIPQPPTTPVPTTPAPTTLAPNSLELGVICGSGCEITEVTGIPGLDPYVLPTPATQGNPQVIENIPNGEYDIIIKTTCNIASLNIGSEGGCGSLGFTGQGYSNNNTWMHGHITACGGALLFARVAVCEDDPNPPTTPAPTTPAPTTPAPTTEAPCPCTTVLVNIGSEGYIRFSYCDVPETEYLYLTVGNHQLEGCIQRNTVEESPHPAFTPGAAIEGLQYTDCCGDTPPTTPVPTTPAPTTPVPTTPIPTTPIPTTQAPAIVNWSFAEYDAAEGNLTILVNGVEVVNTDAPASGQFNAPAGSSVSSTTGSVPANVERYLSVSQDQPSYQALFSDTDTANVSYGFTAIAGRVYSVVSSVTIPPPPPTTPAPTTQIPGECRKYNVTTTNNYYQDVHYIDCNGDAQTALSGTYPGYDNSGHTSNFEICSKVIPYVDVYSSSITAVDSGETCEPQCYTYTVTSNGGTQDLAYTGCDGTEYYYEGYIAEGGSYEVCAREGTVQAGNSTVEQGGVCGEE